MIQLWGEVRWAGCVDLLIGRLKEDDQFWAQQTLEPGWWNHDVDSPLTQQRREVYGEVYSAVNTLSKIADPRAKEPIELTRRRWTSIQFENPQIVEACDAALKRFAAMRENRAPTPPPIRRECTRTPSRRCCGFAASHSSIFPRSGGSISPLTTPHLPIPFHDFRNNFVVPPVQYL